MSKVICSEKHYIVRLIDKGLVPLQKGMVDLCLTTIAQAFNEWSLPGQLYITLVNAEGLDVDTKGPAIGLYHEGIEHCAICCCGKPEEFEGSDSDWDEEITKTVKHELNHYRQDVIGLMGPQGDSVKLEADCEEKEGQAFNGE